MNLVDYSGVTASHCQVLRISGSPRRCRSAKHHTTRPNVRRQNDTVLPELNSPK